MQVYFIWLLYEITFPIEMHFIELHLKLSGEMSQAYEVRLNAVTSHSAGVSVPGYSYTDIGENALVQLFRNVNDTLQKR